MSEDRARAQLCICGLLNSTRPLLASLQLAAGRKLSCLHTARLNPHVCSACPLAHSCLLCPRCIGLQRVAVAGRKSKNQEWPLYSFSGSMWLRGCTKSNLYVRAVYHSYVSKDVYLVLSRSRFCSAKIAFHGEKGPKFFARSLQQVAWSSQRTPSPTPLHQPLEALLKV